MSATCTTSLILKGNYVFHPRRVSHMTIRRSAITVRNCTGCFAFVMEGQCVFCDVGHKFIILYSWICCFNLKSKATAPRLTAASVRVVVRGFPPAFSAVRFFSPSVVVIKFFFPVMSWSSYRQQNCRLLCLKHLHFLSFCRLHFSNLLPWPPVVYIFQKDERELRANF